MNRANAPGVKDICKYARVCVWGCVFVLVSAGVCGGQEAQPVGKHQSERTRGRLMVTARAGLAAAEDAQTDTHTLSRAVLKS